MRVELHPEARVELRHAVFWYEEQSEGLGDALMAEIEVAFDRILAGPKLFSPWPGVFPRDRWWFIEQNYDDSRTH